MRHSAVLLALSCAALLEAVVAWLASRKDHGVPRWKGGVDVSVLPVSIRWRGRELFNPSLVLDGLQCTLTARRGTDTDSDVCVFHGPLRSLGEADPQPRQGLQGFLDVRQFAYGDGRSIANRAYAGGTAMFMLDLETKASTMLRVPGERDLWEKNWVAIPHGDEIYAVHTLSPFRLLRVSPDGGCADEPVATRNWLPELRGSSVARRVPGGWLAAGHIRQENPLEYKQCLLLLSPEPPFLPLAATPLFAFVGLDTEAETALGGWHFLNDIVPAGDELLFSIGANDSEGLIVSSPLEATMQRLQRLQAL